MKQYHEYRVCEAMKLAVKILTEDTGRIRIGDLDFCVDDTKRFKKQVITLLEIQDEFIAEPVPFNFHAVNVGESNE